MVLYILVWIVFCMLNSLLGSFSDVMDRLVARVFFSIFLPKESKTCLIHMIHKQKKLLVNNFRPGNRLVAVVRPVKCFLPLRFCVKMFVINLQQKNMQFRFYIGCIYFWILPSIYFRTNEI